MELMTIRVTYTGTRIGVSVDVSPDAMHCDLVPKVKKVRTSGAVPMTHCMADPAVLSRTIVLHALDQVAKRAAEAAVGHCGCPEHGGDTMALFGDEVLAQAAAPAAAEHGEDTWTAAGGLGRPPSWWGDV